jgi:hypothetical protein
MGRLDSWICAEFHWLTMTSMSALKVKSLRKHPVGSPNSHLAVQVAASLLPPVVGLMDMLEG